MPFPLLPFPPGGFTHLRAPGPRAARVWRGRAGEAGCAAERRAKTGASEPSSAVDLPIAASEVAVTPAPDLEALATLLAGKEMTEEERAEIVAPLMQSL